MNMSCLPFNVIPWEQKRITHISITLQPKFIFSKYATNICQIKCMCTCCIMYVYIHSYSFNKYLLQTHTFKICIYMARIFKVWEGFLIISHLASEREVWICYDPFCKCVLQKNTIKIQYESLFEECPSVWNCDKCNESHSAWIFAYPCYRMPLLPDKEVCDFHFSFHGLAVSFLTSSYTLLIFQILNHSSAYHPYPIEVLKSTDGWAILPGFKASLFPFLEYDLEQNT